jgi:integrase
MNPKTLGNTKDGFQKRGNKWSYRYSVFDPITKRNKQVRISGFRTKEEAIADKKVKEYEAQKGLYVPKSKETVSDLFSKWIKFREDTREKKIATLNRDKQMLSWYILPKLGHLSIQDLTGEYLGEFFREFLKSGGKNNRPLSHGTYKACRTTLNQGLEYAVKLKRIPFNPLLNMVSISGKTKTVSAYTPKEIKTLLEALIGYRLYAFFFLLCHLGARKGEICALRWSDLNFENRTLSIKKTRGKSNGREYEVNSTKNKRGMRDIHISIETVKVLRAHQERQQLEKMMCGSAWQDSGYIFTKEDGSPVDSMRAYFIFKKVIKKLGLRDEPLHVLRHSHITALLRQGVSPEIVASRVGDTVKTILTTYASVKPEDDRLSAEIFSELVASA